jgi:hypothetical protein
MLHRRHGRLLHAAYCLLISRPMECEGLQQEETGSPQIGRLDGLPNNMTEGIPTSEWFNGHGMVGAYR